MVKKRAPHDSFLRNHEPNCVPEMSLSYLQNMPIYFPSEGNINFQFVPFLRVLLHNHLGASYFVPLKRMFGA